jgi:hypothetical protein
VEQTAQQAKADNMAHMGDAVGQVYSALWQEVAWIHKKWTQYVELFGTSPQRINLLNDAAPAFFRCELHRHPFTWDCVPFCPSGI